MSEPIGEGAGAMAQAQVQAIVENAQSLGLTWGLRLATVTGYDGTTALAMLDGDSVPVAVTPMTGPVVVGERIYVLIIPPGGNYAIGGPPVSPGFGALWSDRQTLSATTASVSFTVPTNLRSLRLKWRARCNSGGVAFEQVRMRVNGSAAASYSYETQVAFDAVSSAAVNAGQTSQFVGYVSGATAGAGIFGVGEVVFQAWDISGASVSNIHSAGVVVANGIWTGGSGVSAIAGPWTSLLIFPAIGSWVSGSDFQLEGIAS